MQPGVTVALATVWLVVAGVVGAVTLHPLRLSHDQYSPLPPRRHGVQQDQTGWRDHDPLEDQPLDLWIGTRKSILAEESPSLPRSAEIVGPDFPLGASQKDVVSSKQVFPPSGWQGRLPKIAGLEFATVKVDYGEMPETLSREVPPSDPDDPFVADDTFQDEGPGSVEIYKLDLSKEKALLTATTLSSILSPDRAPNKNKAPKKTAPLNSKAKATEVKSTTSPKTQHGQSNFFEEQRTEMSVNRDVFGIGGVPELQVGCEGLEALSHKTRRSIDTPDEVGRVPTAWLDVTPVSLDLDYDLSYDEEDYEEMDELLKLKRLESTTRRSKPNRGDMDATLNFDHLDGSRRPEKFPVRGDLGESAPVNSSGFIDPPSKFRIDRNESRKGIASEAGTKEAAVLSDNDRLAEIHGRRLLSLFAQANGDGTADEKRKRAKRSMDWGFGEDEGVVASDELQTVNERRRQHEMRFHQGPARRYHQREMHSDVDSIKREYERLLEQKRREEEEEWRKNEAYRRGTGYTVTPRTDDDETRRGEVEEQRRPEAARSRTENDERREGYPEERRRLQEMARRNEEEERRREEEERRRQSQGEEAIRGKQQDKWRAENARGSKMGDEERRRRLHDEEVRRREEEQRRHADERRRYEEEQRRLRNKESDQQDRYPERSQEAARRRAEEERRRTNRIDPTRNLSVEDRRKLEERRREWSNKRRQEEENERRLQDQRKNQVPSNLMHAGHRVGPNDSGQRDNERERRMREQEERERERKLREYIERNRPIRVKPISRRVEDEIRRHPTEVNRDSLANANGEAEEQRRRQKGEHGPGDYIERKQPLNVPQVNNRSTAGNWFEERKRIEDARLRGRYPDSETARRHGPSAPTDIDPRTSPEQVRRRQEARRLQDERQAREMQLRYEAEERRKELARRRQEEERKLLEEQRKEAVRREDEARRAQSRRYEEERKRLQTARMHAEKSRQEMLEERARESGQAGRTRQPEATRSPYQDPRLLEHRRRQDTRPIPSNLTRDEAGGVAEGERQKQEADKVRQEENRIREERQREMQTDQWRRQEIVRLNALPVSARIIVRSGGPSSPGSPMVISRTGFGNEIDFSGINPNREGVQVAEFPVAPTKRPPAQSPGPCVWAVVQCCSSNNHRLVKCFESMGCPGINWDPDPCRSPIAQAARTEVMKFYASAENH